MKKTKTKSKKKWLKGAIKHPGALRKTLHAKKGQPIPLKKLKSATKGNSVTARRARLAMTMRKFNL